MIQSFIIPPRANSGAGELGSFAMMSAADGWRAQVGKYVSALAAADADQIAAARPQIYYTVQCLYQKIDDRAFGERSVRAGDFGFLVDTVLTQGRAAIVTIDRNPRSRYSAVKLTECMIYAAEAEIVLNAAAERGLSEQDGSSAADALAEFGRESAIIAEQLSARYPETTACLIDVVEAKRKAAERIAAFDFRTPDLSRDRFAEVLSGIGDRDELRRTSGRPALLADEGAKAAPYGSRWDVARIAAEVDGLLRDFDLVMNENGFLSDVRMTAVGEARISAYRIAAIASGRTSRPDRQSLYETDAKYERRKAAFIEDKPFATRKAQMWAMESLVASNESARIFDELEQAVTGSSPRLNLSFVRDGDMLVGSTGREGEPVVIILDDHDVRNDRRPDAVRIVVAPHSALAAARLGVDEVMAHGFVVGGTNSMSVVEAFAELSSPHLGIHFGGRLAWHDGAQVMGATTQLKGLDYIDHEIDSRQRAAMAAFGYDEADEDWEEESGCHEDVGDAAPRPVPF